MSEQHTTITNSDTEIMRQLKQTHDRIEIFFQGKDYCYHKDELPVTIGRDPEECTLSCDSSTVSRRHCTIEVKNNQIGIHDQSTNGTYIKIGRSESVLIKDSFFPLVSQGNISLGEQIDMNSKHIIHFRICSNRSKNS